MLCILERLEDLDTEIEIDEFISEEKELQHELDANAHEIKKKVSEHERKVAT